MNDEDTQRRLILFQKLETQCHILIVIAIHGLKIQRHWKSRESREVIAEFVNAAENQAIHGIFQALSLAQAPGATAVTALFHGQIQHCGFAGLLYFYLFWRCSGSSGRFFVRA